MLKTTIQPIYLKVISDNEFDQRRGLLVISFNNELNAMGSYLRDPQDGVARGNKKTGWRKCLFGTYVFPE